MAAGGRPPGAGPVVGRTVSVVAAMMITTVMTMMTMMPVVVMVAMLPPGVEGKPGRGPRAEGVPSAAAAIRRAKACIRV